MTPSGDLRRRWLASMPDLPRWVETRGALLDDRAELFGTEDGGVVKVDDQRFLSVVGEPREDAIRAALDGVGAGWALVCDVEASEHWSSRLAGWTLEVARVHELGELRPAVPAIEGLIERVEASSTELLADLPQPLRAEIAAVAGRRPLLAFRVGGRALSFCYAAFETETLWDVSVDTLEEYRRRGLAGACASHLIRHMASKGKRPVWAAVESNDASLGLAARLGFREVDRIAVLEL